MKIFLWGFMGCGKSTLRKELSLPGFDFDDELLKRFGKESECLGDFIDRLDWNEFRLKEFELFQEVMNEDKAGVYSLGGGCLLDSHYNWPKLNGDDQILIWLKTDPIICWNRICHKSNRPLVSKGKEQFLELYGEREEFYAKSHYITEEIDEIKAFIAEKNTRDL